MEIKSAEDMRVELLTAALADLKAKASEVIDGVMGDLYCAYLPHVETDTESNIGTRVDGVVKNLVSGKFEECGDSMVAVSDGYGRNHFISINSYDGLVKPLCDLMGPQITDARIEQLENQVESLKRQLEEAYRR